MNDDFFDPLDDELRRRFDAATPRTPSDPDAVLDALRPQMRRARTRHRAAIGGAVAGFVALVAVAGFALTGGSSNPNVNTPPATRSTPRPEVPVTTLPVTPTPTVDDNGGSATSPTVPGEDSSNSGSSGNSGSGSSGSGETTPAAPGPQTQTFSSPGGSITVSLTNGALSLAGTSPAAGATAQVNKNETSRVEVEFFDADNQRISRIRVDLVGGAMVPTVD